MGKPQAAQFQCDGEQVVAGNGEVRLQSQRLAVVSHSGIAFTLELAQGTAVGVGTGTQAARARVVCTLQQGIEAADGLDWAVLSVQNVGQLQLRWAMVWLELQQLAIKLFGFWPSLRFLEVSRRTKQVLKLLLRSVAGLV